MKLPDSVFAGLNVKLSKIHKNQNVGNIIQHSSRSDKRHNSIIKTPSHSKDEITGIYKQDSFCKNGQKSNAKYKSDEKVPKSMLALREQLERNVKDAKRDKLISKFATSNLQNSILKPKSDFDNIIKEWSSTNWLKNTPLNLHKPCHILVHDKLLFNNLSLFDTVHKLITNYITEIRGIDPKAFQNSWNIELTKLLTKKTEKVSKYQIEKSLRDLIDDVYRPFLNTDTGKNKFNKLVKDSFLIRKISETLFRNVNYDENIFSKLKNIENLNDRNDLTIIKDHELTMIPSLDYINLLKKINNKRTVPLSKLNILKYKSILGNKSCDYQNLQILKGILTSKKLHCNESFILITDERSTSLEYFRLLKLFNKIYSNYKLKGCVVYLDREHSRKDIRFVNKKNYTGKELYYVAEEFSDIYDIIEVL